MTLSQSNRIQLEPQDEYNLSLLQNVHPETWINPTAQPIYDVVVLGAGTAGLVTAKGAAGLGIGLKVALVEKHLMGGDCLNVGCVPSKCLIRAGRAIAQVEEAGSFGVQGPESIAVNFGQIMTRMRRVRAQISPADSVEGAQKVGVDVFLGEGRFTGTDTLEVAGQVLRFKKAVIATGARAVCPAIDGLAEAGFLTNETVFSLGDCPQRLAVIGGGPIGCELAQAFRRFGSAVYMLERGDHLLPREDPDAAAVVQQTFLREGVELFFNCQLQRVTKTAEGKVLEGIQGSTPFRITVDEILVGAGRAPNVEGLNLEAVGVAYDARTGVQVNDYLQTTNPRIFAAGDICMNWKFTHAADAAARIVLKNMLFSPLGLGRSRLSQLVMPWTTYTDPEVAHVGLYEQQAQDQGLAMETIKISFDHIDRAIADGEENGFVKIHYGRGGKILGATIVARHGGEMISELTTAIVHRIGLGQLATVIHPYPTQGDAIKRAADAYRRTLLTPKSQYLLKWLSRFS